MPGFELPADLFDSRAATRRSSLPSCRSNFSILTWTEARLDSDRWLDDDDGVARVGTAASRATTSLRRSATRCSSRPIRDSRGDAGSGRAWDDSACIGDT